MKGNRSPIAVAAGRWGQAQRTRWQGDADCSRSSYAGPGRRSGMLRRVGGGRTDGVRNLGLRLGRFGRDGPGRRRVALLGLRRRGRVLRMRMMLRWMMMMGRGRVLQGVRRRGMLGVGMRRPGLRLVMRLSRISCRHDRGYLHARITFMGPSGRMDRRPFRSGRRRRVAVPSDGRRGLGTCRTGRVGGVARHAGGRSRRSGRCRLRPVTVSRRRGRRVALLGTRHAGTARRQTLDLHPEHPDLLRLQGTSLFKISDLLVGSSAYGRRDDKAEEATHVTLLALPKRLLGRPILGFPSFYARFAQRPLRFPGRRRAALVGSDVGDAAGGRTGFVARTCWSRIAHQNMM